LGLALFGITPGVRQEPLRLSIVFSVLL
jgi:hypothetical protein